MIDNWVSFFISFFGSLFSLLSNFKIIGQISLLDFMIAFLLMAMLIGTFIARGRAK